MADYDVAVIGAGSVGAAAAYHLAGTGRRVLLLEQFHVGHNRGSSHGESRIIRHTYSSPDYASLAPAAFEMWRDLEAESGAELLKITGGLDLGKATNPALLACRDSLESAGFEFEWLEGESARLAIPQFNFPEGYAVLRQSGAGILHAARSVAALVRSAGARGATLIEGARVEHVDPTGSEVDVSYATDAGQTTISAGRVIVAAGPWATKWFPSLGLDAELKVTHQQVVYYPVEDVRLWAADRCPIYIGHGREGFYGFPVWERPGFIKVGIELDAVVDDADVPTLEPDENALQQLNLIVAERFHGIRPEPADVITCRYTETPDRDFIIDRHPRHPNVVLASPCSGHGFKFSILTGKLAADLATTPPGQYDSPHWRPRFALSRPPVASVPLAPEWRA